MSRSADVTRRRILDAAYDLFYAHGFSRVGVDAVAERAGITKRTLYAHFESKDELLARVLELQHELALARLRRWSERVSGNAPNLIDTLFAELGRWASKPRWSGAGFTRLALELADRPGHPARAIASRHKAAVEEWLARALHQRGVPDAPSTARRLMVLLEGTIALMVIHGDKTYVDEASAAAHHLLEKTSLSPSDDVDAPEP